MAKTTEKNTTKPKAAKKAVEKKPVETQQNAAQASEVLILPVKAQQNRAIYEKPFRIRTPGTQNIITDGKEYRVIDSSFNPETKRYEHQLAEIAVMDAEKSDKELVSRGWIKFS